MATDADYRPWAQDALRSPLRALKWKWTGYEKGYYGDYRVRRLSLGPIEHWAVEKVKPHKEHGQYAYWEVNQFTSRDVAKNFVEVTHELGES